MTYGKIHILQKAQTLYAYHAKLCQYQHIEEQNQDNQLQTNLSKKFRLALYPIQNLLVFQMNQRLIIFSYYVIDIPEFSGQLDSRINHQKHVLMELSSLYQTFLAFKEISKKY